MLLTLARMSSTAVDILFVQDERRRHRKVALGGIHSYGMLADRMVELNKSVGTKELYLVLAEGKERH